MHPDFEHPGLQGFTLLNALPETYKGPLLKGSIPVTATSDAGIIILQQLDHPLFQVAYSIYHFLQPVNLIARQTGSILTSLFALKNDLHCDMKVRPPLRLKEGQFALFRGPDQTLSASFEPGREFQLVEIAWSVQILEELLPAFPQLEKLLTSSHPAKATYFKGPGQAMHAAAIDVIWKILQLPYREQISLALVEQLVREYLVHLLAQTELVAANKIRLNRDEQEAIRRVAEKIRSQLHKQFRIAEHTRDALMNSRKMQEGFRAMYGETIKQYEIGMKMRDAKHLLLTTNMSTKEIAGKIGYQHTTTFIQKFREYFGYTPGYVIEHKPK